MFSANKLFSVAYISKTEFILAPRVLSMKHILMGSDQTTTSYIVSKLGILSSID
jgi:hypothetical protein